MQREIAISQTSKQMFISQPKLSSALFQVKAKQLSLLPTINLNTYDKTEDDLEFNHINYKADVINLPNIIPKSQSKSNILEKITSNKKQKHEDTMDDFSNALGSISLEMEEYINSASNKLIECLQEKDLFIENKMLELENENNLVKMEKKDIDDIWNYIAEQSTYQHKLVDTYDKEISLIELSRMDKIKNLLKFTTLKLEEIAYLEKDNLERVIDEECQFINKTLLANKRLYSVMQTNILIATMEQQKKQHIRYLKAVDAWKEIQISNILTKFKRQTESEDIQNPNEIICIFSILVNQQIALNKKKISQICLSLDFKPVEEGIKFFEIWKNEIFQIDKEMEILYESSFAQINNLLNNICHKLLEEIANISNDLVERYICKENEVEDLAKNKCLLMVEVIKNRYEHIMQCFQIMVSKVKDTSIDRVDSLSHFLEDLFAFFDNVSLNIKSEWNLILHNLGNYINETTIKNIELENALEMAVDNLRQGATEAQLNVLMEKCVEILDKLKNSYNEYLEEQSKIVLNYDSKICEIINKYENDFFLLLNISANQGLSANNNNNDKENLKSQVISDLGNVYISTKNQLYAPENVISEPEIEKANFQLQKTKSIEKITDKSSEYFTNKSDNFDDVTLITKESIKCDKNTSESIWVNHCLHLWSNYKFPSTNCNIERIEALGEEVPQFINCIPLYLVNLSLGEFDPNEFYIRIRINFLNFFEYWKLDTIQNSKELINNKIVELKREHAFKLKQHEPRIDLIKRDIHNVRVAELEMHSERINRHAKWVEQSIVDIKMGLQNFSIKLNLTVISFEENIKNLENCFNLEAHSSKMEKEIEESKLIQKSFMENIKVSVKKCITSVDDKIKQINLNNTDFLKSSLLFSDGGNFCVNEILSMKKLVLNLASQIEKSQFEMREILHSIESDKMIYSMDVLTKFVEKFKFYIVDKKFLELRNQRLVSIKVKIKSELAVDTQISSCIVQTMDLIDQQLFNITSSLDMNLVKDILNNMNEVFELIKDRSILLGKKIIVDSKISQTELDTGFVKDNSKENLQSVLETSKPGKNAIEDDAVKIIQKILKSRHSPQMDSVQNNNNNNVKSTKNSNINTKKNSPLGKKPKELESLLNYFGKPLNTDEIVEISNKIKNILSLSIEDAAVFSEEFYKELHQCKRKLTWPLLIQYNNELFLKDFLESLIKLESDFNNTFDYTFNEFLSQLTSIEEKCCYIFEAIFGCQLDDRSKLLVKKNCEFILNFDSIMKETYDIRLKHKLELKSDIGHPSKQQQFSDIIIREENRYLNSLNLISMSFQQYQAAIGELYLNYTADICNLAMILLPHCDNLLTAKEMTTATQAEIEIPFIWEGIKIEELIFSFPEKSQGVDNVNISMTSLEKDQNDIKSDSNLDLNQNEINLNSDFAKNNDNKNNEEIDVDIEIHSNLSDESISKATPIIEKSKSDLNTIKESASKSDVAVNKRFGDVTTLKSTAAHQSIVDIRNSLFQRYNLMVREMLNHMEERINKEICDEKEWKQYWNISIEQLRALHSC